jgi:hypothetical protein
VESKELMKRRRRKEKFEDGDEKPPIVYTIFQESR